MDDNAISHDKQNGKRQDIKALYELITDTIMDYSQDTIYFKDKQSRFLLISKSQAEKLGLSDPAEAIGKSDFDFFLDKDAKVKYEDEQRIIKTGVAMLGKIEKDCWTELPSSWASTSKYPLYDNNGEIIGTWGLSRDITDQKKAEAELERVNNKLVEANKKLELLSKSDSLSGLLNHRRFHEEASRMFKLYKRQKDKGSKSIFSLILFDIDNFKSINDSYGHLAGDIAVKHVADLLKKSIRSTDTPYRYAGDEFVVLLPDTSNEEAQKVAKKIARKVEETPIMYNKSKICITISGGVSAFEEAADIKELIEIADKRLYISKENGKNRIS